MDRISTTTLANMFDNMVREAERAGFLGTHEWRLTIGSKTNGIAFRVVRVSPENGAHYKVRLFPDMGYVGMTRREAYAILSTVAQTLMCANVVQGR